MKQTKISFSNKSEATKIKLLLGLSLFIPSLFIPSLCLANPQIAKSNPEKLIGALDLGADFATLPKPLIPLYGSPENPDFSKCPNGPDDFGHGQKMCTYQTTDGINYHIDNLGKIYEINLKPDANGKWPKPLPLGIKTNFHRKKMHKYLWKIGIEPWRYTVFHDLNYLRDACFYTKDANNNNTQDFKMVCFIYDEAENASSKKITEMRIFYHKKDRLKEF